MWLAALKDANQVVEGDWEWTGQFEQFAGSNSTCSVKNHWLQLLDPSVVSSAWSGKDSMTTYAFQSTELIAITALIYSSVKSKVNYLPTVPWCDTFPYWTSSGMYYITIFEFVLTFEKMPPVSLLKMRAHLAILIKNNVFAPNVHQPLFHLTVWQNWSSTLECIFCTTGLSGIATILVVSACARTVMSTSKKVKAERAATMLIRTNPTVPMHLVSLCTLQANLHSRLPAWTSQGHVHFVRQSFGNTTLKCTSRWLIQLQRLRTTSNITRLRKPNVLNSNFITKNGTSNVGLHWEILMISMFQKLIAHNLF